MHTKNTCAVFFLSSSRAPGFACAHTPTFFPQIRVQFFIVDGAIAHPRMGRPRVYGMDNLVKIQTYLNTVRAGPAPVGWPTPPDAIPLCFASAADKLSDAFEFGEMGLRARPDDAAFFRKLMHECSRLDSGVCAPVQPEQMHSDILDLSNILDRAASTNDYSAGIGLVQLGRLLLKGTGTLVADQRLGNAVIRKAGSLGSVEALCILGRAAETGGYGLDEIPPGAEVAAAIEPSTPRTNGRRRAAFSYFEEAAKSGSASGMYGMARCSGFPDDLIDKAISYGSAEACVIKARRLKLNGDSVMILPLLALAAARGDRSAQDMMRRAWVGAARGEEMVARELYAPLLFTHINVVVNLDASLRKRIIVRDLLFFNAGGVPHSKMWNDAHVIRRIAGDALGVASSIEIPARTKTIARKTAGGPLKIPFVFTSPLTPQPFAGVWAAFSRDGRQLSQTASITGVAVVCAVPSPEESDDVP